jgi:predicted RNase H-like nuclease (RuvC/YqgF family)
VSSDAPETNGTPEGEWQRLEGALHELLRVFDELAASANQSQEHVKQLESAMRNASGSGELDPVALANRVTLLEQENRFLARRLDRARESVKRISARLQFLQDDR